jgi:hypothetical protein
MRVFTTQGTTLPISLTTSTGRLSGAASEKQTKKNILNALTPIDGEE